MMEFPLYLRLIILLQKHDKKCFFPFLKNLKCITLLQQIISVITGRTSIQCSNSVLRQLGNPISKRWASVRYITTGWKGDALIYKESQIKTQQKRGLSEVRWNGEVWERPASIARLGTAATRLLSVQPQLLWIHSGHSNFNLKLLKQCGGHDGIQTNATVKLRLGSGLLQPVSMKTTITHSNYIKKYSYTGLLL